MTTEITEFEAPAGVDTHVHFRGPNESGGEQDPSMMHKVVNETTHWCDSALPMPNPDPPILTAADELCYYDQYMGVNTNPHFEPIRSMQLTESTPTREIERAAGNGVKSLKAYPLYLTHNSQNGIGNYWTQRMRDKYQCASDCGLMVNLHPEFPDPDLYWEDREKAFVERVIWWLADQYPDLWIGVEHISAAWTVNAVHKIHRQRGRILGGFTCLHMLITANDVVGGALQPHNFCKPMAKRPEDRKAIQEAILSCAEPGWEWVVMGLDSAPHLATAKQELGRPGSFQALSAPGLITEFFDQHNKLSSQPAFMSGNARKIYRLGPAQRNNRFLKQTHEVDRDFRGVVPFWAGKEVSWQLVREF